jgi:hypothetical protein
MTAISMSLQLSGLDTFPLLCISRSSVLKKFHQLTSLVQTANKPKANNEQITSNRIILHHCWQNAMLAFKVIY